MYYLLTLIGVILIVIGISDYEFGAVPRPKDKTKEYKDLIRRIEDLESTLYAIDFDFEEEVKVKEVEPTYESVSKSINVPDESVKIFNTLRQCEEEGYSLEETCLLLNMNKGEVLLLKNLYKNYQK